MKIIQIKVCESCLSPDIVDTDCSCCTSNFYKTVVLEFEECECCGQLKGGYLKDSEFNINELKKLNTTQ
jgi:hypothetical protein